MEDPNEAGDVGRGWEAGDGLYRQLGRRGEGRHKHLVGRLQEREEANRASTWEYNL